MAVAMSRNINVLLIADLMRNPGKTVPNNKEYIATKTGRLLMIVETRDTGPLCIAQYDSTIPIGAIVSLKAIKLIATLFRFISLSSLRTWGRIENSRKLPDMLNATRENKFQNEI